MENDELFKPRIGLREFSAVAEAINYWESPTIRGMIRQCASDDEFNHVLLEVLRKVENTRLPPPIKVLLPVVIPFIGKETFHWIRYVTLDLKLGLQYTEKMYWTNYGTIDEAKTFQLYWQNDTNLLSEYSNGLPSLYSIACINCQEQFFSENLDHMREVLQNYCGSFLNIPKDVNAYSLMSIWICCYAKKSKEQGCELYKTVTQSNDPEAKLFEICVSNGFLNGVKYFGNRLESGRDSLFYRRAVFTLREQHSVCKQLRLSDKRNNFIEIIIFLIKEMIPKTRSLYLCRNLKNLFEILIQVWPHNKSFLFQIFNCTLHDMQESDQENILTTVFSYLEELNGNPTTCRTTRDFMKNISREILGRILKQIPVHLKHKIIIDNAGDFFKKLIYQPDVQTIDVIFKDSYIKTLRHEIVTKNIVEALHPNYVTGKDFDYLENFTEKYLTGEEKNEFKSKFKSVNNFREILTEGKLDLCKKLICWRAQSQEEMRNLKMGINAKDVFLNAVSEKNVEPFLSIADKLLNWQFDNDKEQIRAFKEKMRSEVGMSDDSIRAQFYDIWKGKMLRKGINPLLIQCMCSQFLLFVFDRDEAKIFIKENIFRDENFIKHLTPGNLRHLNYLLRCCGLTLAEIIELKREKLKDIDSVILYYAIERYHFIANGFLNWLVDD